jgi:cell division protein FtsB
MEFSDSDDAIDRPPSGLHPAWVALPRILIALIFFVGIAIALAGFRPQLRRQSQLDATLHTLETQKAQETAARDAIKNRLEWARSDHAFRENQARDLLNWAAPGEVVIRFPRGE